jgi:hypothetical protein
LTLKNGRLPKAAPNIHPSLGDIIVIAERPAVKTRQGKTVSE